MKIGTSITAIVLLVTLVIVMGPLLMIWALNTLFPVLGIAYSFETWISIVILAGLFRTTVKVEK
jgi:hypothetical protein